MINKFKHVLQKDVNINLLLLLCSFGIYFIYFHHIFFNLNSILSSITLDSLKNYYTYVYHIKNDMRMLHFEGMNFPYGEHVVFTDCQPILTFILRILPFTHDYLIGILHALMFSSFIITPLILNKIFRLLAIDRYSSFFVSLAIGLLSPQFLKINAGHFALAYGCVIPFIILLLLNCLKHKSLINYLKIFIFNTALFLLHPYLGLGSALFSFTTLIICELFYFRKKETFKHLLLIFASNALPIILFRAFIMLTDHHQNRTVEPYGLTIMLENFGSILTPVFGPFRSFLENIFPARTDHFEGHSYLGLFSILISLLLLIILPFQLKKLKSYRELTALFISSILMLLFSFGLHIYILEFLNLKISLLNQFRAVCRYAWFFYFALPIFVFPILYHLAKDCTSEKKFKIMALSFSLLFFSSNMIEGHFFFKLDANEFWKFRNFFNEKYLNSEEKTVLRSINSQHPQAIITLPLFYVGSEMYERLGLNNSMIPAMIYSYHSKLPIVGAMLSRTSLTETEDVIQLFNSYKKEKSATTLLNSSDFLILKTNDVLFPDEEKLLKKTKFFQSNDTLNIGYLKVKDLLERKLDKQIFKLKENIIQNPDSNNVVYIPTENRKPFTVSNMIDYEKIYVLDSNRIKSGNYIVSLHYYYHEKTYQSVACNVIITRGTSTDYKWIYDVPVRTFSGFYKQFGVFEYKIYIDSKSKYEFVTKGILNHTYTISDFLLRPENKTTVLVKEKNDTIFNNFPVN